MCLKDDTLSVCEKLQERTNIGIALLNPSVDVNYAAPDNFLTYLTNIPGDLLDFYTSFGFHVRRGFQTLQKNLNSNPIVSNIASYLPKNKNDVTDDPTSPYSINYSGEYNKNHDYSYTIRNKNGSHSVKFTSNPSLVETLRPPGYNRSTF